MKRQLKLKMEWEQMVGERLQWLSGNVEADYIASTFLFEKSAGVSSFNLIAIELRNIAMSSPSSLADSNFCSVEILENEAVK